MTQTTSSPPKTETEEQLRQELRALRQRVDELEAEQAQSRQVLTDLRESEEKFRLLLDESSDPIFTFFPDGRYRYVNQAFAKGVGKKQSEIINRTIWDVFPKDEADKRFTVVRWVFEHGETRVIEVRVPRPGGDAYYITTAKPILDEQGQVISVICISKEITERKRMEQELHRLSTHDYLTGLYNRNFFEVELARLQHSRLFPVSIVIVDVDNLKAVNDRFGHPAGDEVLRKAAQALRQSFRAEDLVARIGGDEFGILLPETDHPSVEAAVSRLRANRAKQLENMLDLSIGLATGEEGSALLEVMRLADDRMYQEKLSHKNDRV
jgi:diguanylate cyclase (GGDEF)-like protein/PAS domain S-box-containing protein